MSPALNLRQFVPYVVVLSGAVAFYAIADKIEYSSIPDQLGPDLWPKIILTLLITVCLYEIGRRAFAFNAPAAPEADAPGADDADPVLEEHGADRPWLVAGTVAATVAYLLAIETGGFFLCTIFYAASLMWFGGIRRIPVIAGISLALATFFTFLFMRVIFVALPIGHGVFQKISLVVMTLLGIR